MRRAGLSASADLVQSLHLKIIIHSTHNLNIRRLWNLVINTIIYIALLSRQRANSPRQTLLKTRNSTPEFAVNNQVFLPPTLRPAAPKFKMVRYSSTGTSLSKLIKFYTRRTINIVANAPQFQQPYSCEFSAVV